MLSKMNLRRASSTARTIVWCLSILCAGAANAAEIHVYEGQSIQDAIDGASDGDEIIVHPGTYYECIDFLDKAIDMHSSDGAGVTTIDATGLGYSAVKCRQGQGSDTVLDGFTVTGGYDEDWYSGGGMYIYDSSPTVKNCVFFDNQTDEDGGGIYIGGYSSPSVTNCSFLDNYADYAGGGLYVDCKASVYVANCTFLNNWGYEWGGGLCQSNDDETSTIVNCLFAGNSAYDTAGVGIANAAMTNCTVTGNTASDDYGGVAADDNCTLTNCIFWGNTGDGWEDDLTTWSDAVVTYCDIGVTSFEYHCNGEGNICVDPAFTDAGNDDFHLGPGSSCSDAGNDAAVPSGVVNDLDGNPRFVDADADSNATVDMGAYEFQETCYGVQLTVPAEYATIQEAIDAACFNDEIVVAPGTYPEVVNLHGKPITLRSSDGPAATIIDATGLDSSVVICIGGEGPDTVIEGFTITGGSGSLRYWDYWDDTHHGGGMLIGRSSPTINDCRFIANAVTDDYSHGGAVFIVSGDPVFSNCVFDGNSATGDGGAVYVDSYDYYYCYETSSPTFSGCEFTSNVTSDDGGAIYAYVEGDSSLDLSDCTFSTNSAVDEGGALLMSGYDGVIDISSCVFTGNTAGDDGGAASWWDIGVAFTGCSFISNEAAGGGALCVYGYDNSSSSIENCTFTGNTAIYNGGAVAADGGDVVISNCDFSQNFAVYGGAVCGSGEDDSYTMTLTDCTFTDNDAGYGGGLYCFEFGDATVVGCDFIGNTAFRGGGLRVYFAFVDVIDCSFRENTATDYGGGISNWEGYLTVGTTLFCENEPDHLEGPYIDGGGNEFLAECPGDCPADVDGSGVVDIDDLFQVLSAWGPCDDCPEDINDDGVVDIDDLFAVLAAWGPC